MDCSIYLDPHFDEESEFATYEAGFLGMAYPTNVVGICMKNRYLRMLADRETGTHGQA